MLSSSEAFELSFHHYTNLSAQCLCLLHWVSRQNYSWFLLLLRNSWYHIPHKSTSLWVDTCWRLIKKNNGRVSDKSYCNTKFPFIPSGKLTRFLVLIFFQVSVDNLLLNELIMKSFGNIFKSCMIMEMLLHSHIWNERIKLWTVSNVSTNSLKLIFDVKLMNFEKAILIQSFASQWFKSRSLSSTIDP